MFLLLNRLCFCREIGGFIQDSENRRIYQCEIWIPIDELTNNTLCQIIENIPNKPLDRDEKLMKIDRPTQKSPCLSEKN